MEQREGGVAASLETWDGGGREEVLRVNKMAAGRDAWGMYSSCGVGGCGDGLPLEPPGTRVMALDEEGGEGRGVRVARA